MRDSAEKLPLSVRRKRPAENSPLDAQPSTSFSPMYVCDKRGKRQMTAPKSAARAETENRLPENSKTSTTKNAKKHATVADKEVAEADILELSLNEKLQVREEILELTKKHAGNPPFQIVFDDFMYVQFLRCLRDLCLYMAMPNAVQFQGFEDFLQKSEAFALEKCDYRSDSKKLEAVLQHCCNRPQQNLEEKFFLRQFLKLHLPLLFFYRELNKLLD